MAILMLPGNDDVLEDIPLLITKLEVTRLQVEEKSKIGCARFCVV